MFYNICIMAFLDFAYNTNQVSSIENSVLGNNDAIKLMGEGDGIIYNKKTNVKSHFQSSYISLGDLKEIIIRRN